MMICRGGGEDTLPLLNAPQTCHTAYTYQKESILHQALLHIAVYCEPCEKCAIALESLLTFINIMDPSEADRFGKDLISDPAWGHLGDDSPITIERKALIIEAISSHRSLQKMCQVTIAKCLGWQLDEKIHDLPIPKKLMLFPWGIDTPQSSESGSPTRPKKKGRKIRFSPVIIEEQFVERSEVTDEEEENEEEEDEEEEESQNDTDSVNKINEEKSASVEGELVKSDGTSHEGLVGESSGKIEVVEAENVEESKTEKTNTGQHWDEEFPIEKLVEEDVPDTVQNVTGDKNLETTSGLEEKLSDDDLINDNKGSGEDVSDENNVNRDIPDGNTDNKHDSDKLVVENSDGKEDSNLGDENMEAIKSADEMKGNDENDNELSSDKDSVSVSLSENSNLDSPIRRLDISLKGDPDLDKSTNFEYEDSDDGDRKGKEQGKNIEDPGAKGTSGKAGYVLCSRETPEQEEDCHSDDTASVD